MSQRQRLPARRRSTHYHLTLASASLHIRLGYYPSGAVGELWIDLHKEGAPFRFVLSQLARMASLALQCGAPVEDVVRMLCGGLSTPSGMVEGHPTIVEATSIPDLMGLVLSAGAVAQ